MDASKSSTATLPQDGDPAASAPAAEPKPAVRAVHISKTYKGSAKPAVADLSLDIMEGEIFALLGPSGCGKTTTLRIVAGLESPDSGSLYFGDRPIVVATDRIFMPPEKRRIGMVFQSYAIWPHMTVRENVSYPLRLRKIRGGELESRLREVLDLVGLTALADRPATMLSGGQQQRVALARALVYKPSLLLLDEPFSNLDTKLREQMCLEVKMLQSRLKITVLLVTHDQIEAMSLADRIAVMSDGMVEQTGSPRELYRNPASAFVRDFLGNTVILTGTIGSAGDGVATIALDGHPDVAVTGRIGGGAVFTPGQRALVGLRPEDAVLSDGSRAEAGDTASVPGTVSASLYGGAYTEYRIAIAGQPDALLHTSGGTVFAPGQPARVYIPARSATIWAAS